MSKKFTTTLMNIEIFEFEEVEPLDAGDQYEGVNFKFESLKKYDGMIAYVNSNWDIEVWNNAGMEAEFNIFEVSEFKDILRNKLLLNTLLVTKKGGKQ